MATGKKPVHEVKLGGVRAAVWANQNGDGPAWFNVTITRLYKDAQGNWKDSASFGRDDLLLVAKVADMAHTWVCERLHGGQERPEPEAAAQPDAEP